MHPDVLVHADRDGLDREEGQACQGHPTQRDGEEVHQQVQHQRAEQRCRDRLVDGAGDRGAHWPREEIEASR
nr:hypothetical protein [Nocardioides alcanivorans]